ncbi:MAG TPA: helix-turn-helix transcriptional regulator [Chryseosolibacter sp.]
MKRPRKPVSIAQDPKITLKKIGAKLKKIRKERGYHNGDDFAYDNEINRSQYGKYEAGAQDMRISSLLKTINSLGMTIEEFFSDGLD